MRVRLGLGLATPTPNQVALSGALKRRQEEEAAQAAAASEDVLYLPHPHPLRRGVRNYLTDPVKGTQPWAAHRGQQRGANVQKKTGT